jgi:integrase
MRRAGSIENSSAAAQSAEQGGKAMNKRGQGGVYLRGETYWMRYRLNGAQVRESTGETTEEKALVALHKRIGHVEAGLKVGGSFERATLAEILNDVYTDYEVNDLRSLGRIKQAGEHLLDGFGLNFKAKMITSARVQEYKLARKSDDDAANGTINRELALLKRALTLGERNGKVARKPHIELLPEQAREGFLTHPEYLKLHDALPDDLKDPVHFLYLSGWRVSEMRSLKWSDVDRTSKSIRLRSENSKNKTARLLKPGAELWAIIERAAARQIPALPFVFHRDGKAVGLFRKSWITACTAAKLPGLIVHDLRRCAVRNLVRAGISETVAMKLTGHKTPSIFRRYNVTSEQDIEDAGAKLDAFITAQPTKTADVVQFRKAS